MAQHLATYYGHLSQLWYLSQILCGLATVIFSVAAQTLLLDEYYTSLTNFALSLLCTTLISLHAFANPTTRWHKLRCAAAELESLAWLFRTKCKQFELGEIDSESNSITLFRDQLNEWRRTVVRGTDLHRSDFQRKWSHEKLTRGQHEKSPVYIAGELVGEHLLPKKTSRCSGGFVQLFCCICKRLKPQQAEQEHGEVQRNQDDCEQGDKSSSNAEAQLSKTAASKALLEMLEAGQDDHHSPATADEYIRWRLQTMKRFYERRLPVYAVYHRCIFGLTLLGSMGCSIFAYIELNVWVVAAASLSTAASSWMEFSNVLQNIQRYSDTIQELKKLEAWWESLPPWEKASKENLNLLVCIFQKLEAFVFEVALSRHRNNLMIAVPS